MNTTIAHHPESAPAAPNTSEWVDRYGDYLFHFALGQLGDPLTAEDLVQETFLAALRSQDRFAGTSSERTWLTGILRHKIYDHLRQRCRRRTVPLNTTGERGDDDAMDDSMVWLHEVASECVSPTHRLELAEFRESLETALGTLPTRIEQVFRLYEIEERPGREVCETLQISESNLWVMMHRARKQLREQLGAWWHGRNADVVRTHEQRAGSRC